MNESLSLDMQKSNIDQIQEEKENEIFSVDDLFNAVRYGSSAHVSYIVEKDRNIVNKTDSQGYTSIHWAAKRGDVDILALLFSYGANLDSPSSFESRMLPIHWAASDGKIKSLKFLLDRRQDINSQDANGCSPLIIATQYNQISTVAYLIKNGADVTLRDNNGDTPIHWAAYKGYEELVGLLLHFVPLDLDCEDVFGQTPLHLAALRGNHDVVEYLLSEYGADYGKKDKNGLTPLELSIKKSQLKSEWVIRQFAAKNTFMLLSKLGVHRLKDRRVLVFLLFGSNEREFGQWMWRLTFLSNFVASLISMTYATSQILSDLYGLHLINTAMQFMWWICFLMCLWKSPSFVQDDTSTGVMDSGSNKYDSKLKFAPHSYDAALEVIGSDVSTDSPAYPVVCHTCRVVRPLRSKHCRANRRCVHKFDHFCPFVFNTVGRDNYKYFVGLLLVHPIAYVFFISTTLYYWSRTSFTWLFLLFLAYSLLMFLMVLGLLHYHVKLLSNNLTTNEDINLNRYSYMKNEYNMIQNPFDKGSSWKNIMDGLFPSSKSYFSREDVQRDYLHLNEEDNNKNSSSSSNNKNTSVGGGHHGETEGFFEEARTKLLLHGQ